METYVIIAGCRTYSNYEEAKDYILSCLREYEPTDQITILTGGCKGADLLGERFAKENGFPIIRYPPDWEKYGKKLAMKPFGCAFIGYGTLFPFISFCKNFLKKALQKTLNNFLCRKFLWLFLFEERTIPPPCNPPAFVVQ